VGAAALEGEIDALLRHRLRRCIRSGVHHRAVQTSIERLAPEIGAAAAILAFCMICPGATLVEFS
jgi:hypothetical protein